VIFGVSSRLISEGPVHANFYEKALFVKVDVASLEIVAECNGCSALRAMLLFALSGSPLFNGSVHRMRSVFSSQRRCNLLSGLSSLGMDQVRNCALTFRSEARSGEIGRGYPPL